MKRRLLGATLAVALGISGAGALAAFTAAQPAFAVSCPSPNPDDHQGFGWTHTSGGLADVQGVRSSIKFLKDSDLCDFTMTNSPWNAYYIAVEGTGGLESITQIGFFHDYNIAGVNEWCKFWATKDTGAQAQKYGCTGYSVDDWENVSIHQDGSETHYVIDDCGHNPSPDDYSNCTTKNSSATDFTSPSGEIDMEEFYGSCAMHEWGSGADNARVGSASGSLLPIQGLDSSFVWSARDWGTHSDDDNCTNGGNYNWFTEDQTPTHGVKWYDSRN